MTDAWPPKLKEWVAKCLGQMTDANRAEAQQEMKQVIAQSFEAKTLWTTDWAGVQLQALMPKALPNAFSSMSHASPNGTKRKNETPAPAAKKAKKSALAKSAATNTMTDPTALERRAQRFQREHEIERNKSVITFPPRAAPSLLQRTATGTYASNGDDDFENDSSENKWDHHNIVGTSTQVFKDYLRLTSEPDPAKIRPVHVLEKTLDQLRMKWRELSRTSDNQYNWMCSQFKSMRQDLVVQRVKTAFTVKVYETHARIALEVDDDVEYNACLNQLQLLYEQGLEGSQDEFTAYRILQLVRGLNHSHLNLYVSRLTPAQKGEKCIAHALAVQRAVSAGNYRAFFRLYHYTVAPKMNPYIMDFFRDRERIKALIVMSRSYMKLQVSYISDVLGFVGVCESNDVMDPVTQGAMDTVEFLTKHKAAIFLNPVALHSEKMLDCKATQDLFPRIFDEQYRKVKLKRRI